MAFDFKKEYKLRQHQGSFVAIPEAKKRYFLHNKKRAIARNGVSLWLIS